MNSSKPLRWKWAGWKPALTSRVATGKWSIWKPRLGGGIRKAPGAIAAVDEPEVAERTL